MLIAIKNGLKHSCFLYEYSILQFFPLFILCRDPILWMQCQRQGTKFSCCVWIWSVSILNLKSFKISFRFQESKPGSAIVRVIFLSLPPACTCLNSISISISISLQLHFQALNMCAQRRSADCYQRCWVDSLYAFVWEDSVPCTDLRNWTWTWGATRIKSAVVVKFPYPLRIWKWKWQSSRHKNTCDS